MIRGVSAGRRAGAFALLALASFSSDGLAAPLLQPPATASLDPSAAVIEGCEVIEVAIHIADAVSLYGADVRLAFDPTVVEVVDQDIGAPGVQIEEGDLLAPPLEVVRNEADNTAGTIWFAATQLYPTAPVSGSGDLAVIHLRAKAAGVSDLEYTYSKLATRDGEEIPSSTVDGTVTTHAAIAPDVSIEQIGPVTVQLSWTGVPDVVDYRVYRDPYAYFDPIGPPYATTAATTFDDVGAIGDTSIEHAYVVRAACESGFLSEPSNRVGEFDFDLFPGTGPGLRKYNLIGFPLDVPDIPDADGLADHAGAGVYQVVRHDNAAQAIEFWLPSLMLGTNFPTEVGGTYFLHLEETAASITSFTGGIPPFGSVTTGLNAPLPLSSCRNNFISVPLDRVDILDADDLAADIGGVYLVIRHDNDTQGIDFWIPSLSSGVNFPVRVGYPYIVCLLDTAPATWP